MLNKYNLISSLLIGSRHVLSFDQIFVNLNSKDLNEKCSHLLAHDFVTNQFTITLMTSVSKIDDKNFGSKILVVQAGNDKVELELGNPLGSIKNGNNLTSVLPSLTPGELIITRELNVVTISSKRGFTVECNLEFDVCSILISGW